MQSKGRKERSRRKTASRAYRHRHTVGDFRTNCRGQLSPDGHWMAFTSDRSGLREVYVRPFPPGDGEWTISIAGGE